MSESGTAASPDPCGCNDSDPDGAIAALRARGAHWFDPVRFRYIDALARRAAAHSGDVRQSIDRKLEEALAAYTADYEKARCNASDAMTLVASRFPEAADELQRLHAGGDFSGIRRLAARLEGRCQGELLAGLVHYIDRLSSDAEASAAAADNAVPRAGPPAELKALRHHRSTWSQLGVDRQLTRSLAKAPENPGPLNSHLLVLRSLRRMQEISPAYLERFMSHVDALLWLDQASSTSAPETSKTARHEGDRKRKPRRNKQW